ncbi:MAG TPA: hypothetical protein VHC49_10365, partial [Mycobacteriales bacterium]|nr:hypothetical protein [Mycobacteriales bacterium]
MHRRLIIAVLAVPALFLAACGSSGGDSKPKGPTVAGTGVFKGIDVSNGSTPRITVGKKPFSVSKTSVQVVTPGTGPEITQGQNVTIDYLLVNGRDGKAADTTYGAKKQTFTADPQVVLPGIAKGMLHQKVGSRVLV